jgi:L-ascorbate metabolism protein UlaG (beta-lactamase superfamily)
MSRGSKIALAAAGLAGTLGAAAVATGWALSVSKWKGPVSDHFDGERFRSLEPRGQHKSSGFWKWILHRERGLWRDFTETPPGGRPPERVAYGRMRVTFVNHSTVLVQTDGVNVLTDPVWSKRVSPFSFAGPRRHRPPGLRFEDLPPIDIVLVSHNHYDHMDLPTLRRLVERDHPAIFVGLNNAGFLARHRVAGARDLDWWDSVDLPSGVTVTCVPARHFSARGLYDRDRALWCGFVVTGASGSFYLAGDTGWGAHFAKIAERFPALRLALLPIGAYRPRWFMASAHVDPEQAVCAHETLGASTSLAIHFGTFAQADDGEFEPQAELEEALAKRAVPAPRFLVLDNGESAEIEPDH